jgi:hypothetical protein
MQLLIMQLLMTNLMTDNYANTHTGPSGPSPLRDIRIKPEDSKDNFGDELFEQLIINFVEKDYEEKKTLIEEAHQNKDCQKLYFVVHSFKTTARMLCIEDFALECQEIQDYSHAGKEDWEKLNLLVPLFLKDFESVYNDAKAIYDRDYKPKEVEVLPEFDKSPFFPSSQSLIDLDNFGSQEQKEVKPESNILRFDTIESFKSKEIMEDKEESETEVRKLSKSM